MRIAVDAFGGDNSPREIIKGCAMAVKEFGVDIILCGDENKIKACMEENKISSDGITIQHAEGDAITMEDEATVVIKSKKNSSMAVMFNLLAEDKADACVTAGNTGAALCGATFIVKRIDGVKRAAIAPVMPNAQGCMMLIDCGANVECKPEFLKQFGIMGSVYMKRIMDVKNPRVGLANNGAEETKGTDMHIEAYKLLKESNLNFIGNVEGRDIPLGMADVVVCDGFSGNLILKTIEGMGKWIANILSEMFKKNIFTYLSALIIYRQLRKTKKKLDYREYGGAVLLGVKKPVIKAHGSCDALAFRSSIKQALVIVKADVCKVIENEIQGAGGE